nr:reverse transcriptase domain-containing protein [Tanacetum cinerariifolium]
MRFQQRFNELFYEACDRFNDLLRACPHHGFFELHQLDTFYNALNVNDQDSLNSAAGGNFLDKMPRECLKIIESKSKVRQSRAKAVVTKVSVSSSTPAISFEVAELKDMVRALLLDKKNQSSAPAPSPTYAPVKAVEPNYVTCGCTHSYQNYPATNENDYRDNIQEYMSQAAAANYNQGIIDFRLQMVANQIRPPGFPPVQNNQNNFNRGNNFNQNRGDKSTVVNVTKKRVSMYLKKVPRNGMTKDRWRRGTLRGGDVGVPSCFECGAQGHYKRNCPRLGNKNQGNQDHAGNGNAVARAYGLGTTGG